MNKTVEIRETQEGDPVVVFDNRYLGSSLDPKREATIWADCALTGQSDYAGLIFLGIGSGYQILECARRQPEVHIVVIEEEAIVSHAVRSMHGNLFDQFGIYTSSEFMESQSENIVRLLLNPYRVHTIASTFNLHRQVYQGLRSILVGRQLASLAKLWALRSQILVSEIEAPMDLSVIGCQDTITSAKDFLLNVKKLPLNCRQRTAINIIEEMVQ